MNKFQKIVGVILAGIIVGLLFLANSKSPDNGGQVKGVYNQVTNYFKDGIQVDGESKLGSGVTRWISQTVAAGSNQTVWTNTTGATVFVDEALIGFETGTASSSYKLAVFSTTTSAIPTGQDFVVLGGQNNFSISSITYATSTTATTTNSFIQKASGVVRVPNNSSIVLYMQQVDTAACGGIGACEAATSTKRGFDPYVLFRYIRF